MLLYQQVGDVSTAAENLARNVRALRDARGLTQAAASRRAGIPRGTWATIEVGHANPTLAVLLKIANGLSVSIEELVSPPKGDAKLVPRAALRSRRRNGVTITDLVPDKIPAVQLERLEFEPGAAMRGAPHTSGTREYLACEKGALTLIASAARFDLRAGDVVSFRGDQPHSYRNPHRGRCVAYSVVVLASG